MSMKLLFITATLPIRETGAASRNTAPRPSGVVRESPGIVAGSAIHAKTWAWANSKALLGTIGPVSRARVSDLVNGDPDGKPLSPPQRAP